MVAQGVIVADVNVAPEKRPPLVVYFVVPAVVAVADDSPNAACPASDPNGFVY